MPRGSDTPQHDDAAVMSDEGATQHSTSTSRNSMSSTWPRIRPVGPVGCGWSAAPFDHGDELTIAIRQVPAVERQPCRPRVRLSHMTARRTSGNAQARFNPGCVWSSWTRRREARSRTWSRRPGRATRPLHFSGAAAPEMLPLRRGDMLVVNASDSAVRSRSTCPEAIDAYLRAGVRVTANATCTPM